MSYGNQWDHELLDRHLVRDYLLGMSRGTLKVSSSAKSREDHLKDLIKQCESKLGERLACVSLHKEPTPSNAGTNILQAVYDPARLLIR